MQHLKKVFTALSFIILFTACSSSGYEHRKVQLPQGSTSVPGGLAGIDTAENPYGVMLQGFQWESCNAGGWYSVISTNSSEIKNTFEYVWFPPSSDSGSTNGYLPRELNKLTTPYGTAAQLKQAINDIKPAKAIADIVINHRNGTYNWGTFTNPVWDEDFYAICSNDEAFTRGDSSIVNSDKRGAYDTGASYDSGRDLDHTNTKVQNGIIAWMNDVLKDAGFVGWRYDYVKGYHGIFTGKYNAATDAKFSVGEYWPTASFSPSNSIAWRNEMIKWVNTTAMEGGRISRVFDFVLKGNLNEAFGWKSSSNTSNLSKWDMSKLADQNSIFSYAPASAVTFVDNHDTGSTQQYWELNPSNLGPAYAFILTHPGYPCVAWQHYFTGSGSQFTAGSYVNPARTLTLRGLIQILIGLREDMGIRYDSAVQIISSSTQLYVAKIEGDTGNVLVKISKNSYTVPAGYTTVCSGTGFEVWKQDP
ncbi:hypothetical protein K7I13_15220 [Brucepastera parasyntrophica]|uniref:alpha-amylase C-terminal beta-sheet domain-containing protein n=1 Tax=Brucepastera parasyntrophica TaxID=2880008 RepID=UPI00210A3F62|nr:alpha-amylase family glycosyl hydrolase [Brucepastera parasyntrophica]ULQ59776.1 hypothetical protein K7I13_15220 [Brucepastera parasyntrophica]